ncbi:hypothetical protein PM082_007814 [Marasmius tenuissimus]|nr:hypothetical protein PM082_007814 [Marasmius tenuissimus]
MQQRQTSLLGFRDFGGYQAEEDDVNTTPNSTDLKTMTTVRSKDMVTGLGGKRVLTSFEEEKKEGKERGSVDPGREEEKK